MLLSVALSLILLGVGLTLLKLFLRCFNHNPPHRPERRLKKFAILVMARDESAVIEELLKSIAQQSVKVRRRDVYVVVEDAKDPTVELVRKYKMSVLVRQKLNLRRKGYALMEALEQVTPQGYEAYFIVDADNVLDRDFIKELRQTYAAGYDIGIGRRMLKNQDNAVAVGSGLIFTILNVVSNRRRTRHELNCNVSGTGFYISGRVLNQLGTFPFHTLTEDYELSLYATVHNLTTAYNERACFYDEQPTTLRQYFAQRSRWVKGYLEARKLYVGKLWRRLKRQNYNFVSAYTALVGIYNLLLLIIGLVLLAVVLVLDSVWGWWGLLGLAGLIYAVLAVLTIYLLWVERSWQVPFGLRLRTVLVNPLLLAIYVPCLIRAVLVREMKWEKIEHKNNCAS